MINVLKEALCWCICSSHRFISQVCITEALVNIYSSYKILFYLFFLRQSFVFEELVIPLHQPPECQHNRYMLVCQA